MMGVRPLYVKRLSVKIMRPLSVKALSVEIFVALICKKALIFKND